MAAFELSPWFGLVVIHLVGSVFLHYLWMSMQVSKARKRFNIQYPVLYAPGEGKDAKVFNCIQRAHQNSLEMFPAHTAVTTIVGLKFPVLSALLATVYSVFRVRYFTGYSTGEPKNRLRGSPYYFATFGQLILGVVFGVQLLLGKA